MTAPTVYRSDDDGAPTITGESGSLIGMLDAVLVNGYGAKPAAGWTKPFSDTNLAAYRQAGGNQHYLMIDDTATQMARITCYRTMTAVNTGTGRFPTNVQVTGGMYMRKSTTASTQTRPWIMFATETHFYLIIASSLTALSTAAGSGGDSHLAFGNLKSNIIGDIGSTFVIGCLDTSTTSTSDTLNRQPIPAHGLTATGHYLATNHNFLIDSFNVGQRGADVAQKAASGTTIGSMTYPVPYNSGVLLSEMHIMEGGFVRGRRPGVFSMPQDQANFSNLQTLEGFGALAGRTFMVIRTGSYGFFVELGDWDV